MASQESIAELNKLARVHATLSSLSAKLPAGAQRLEIHQATISSARQVILNRMKEIVDAQA